MGMNFEQECPECFGRGERFCSECNSEYECDNCDGTGIDPEKVELEAFKEATKKAFAGTDSSWEIVEDGIWVGRQAPNGAKVYYRDFLRKP